MYYIVNHLLYIIYLSYLPVPNFTQFLKDHFPPEFLAQFMLGQEKGEEKGIQKGELIGSITALQKILKCKTATKKELRAKTIEELKAMLKELEKQIK